MLDGIDAHGPGIIVSFEMKPKVRTAMAWDGGYQIGLSSDALCATLDKGAAVLQAGTNGHSKDLVAVQVPNKTILHVHNGREISWFHDELGVGSVSKGRKGR
jgi:hypothetical protein